MGPTYNEASHLKNDVTKMTDELKEKIKSKIDVAKFFAGSITLFIGLLFREGKMTFFLSKLGMVFLVISLICCVLCVFAYDYMLWPKDYWHKYKKGQDAEIEFQKKLVKEMRRLWNTFFVPSVICLGLGMLLIIIQIMIFENGSMDNNPYNWTILILLLLTILIPVWLWEKLWADFGDTAWNKEYKEGEGK